MSGLSRRRFIGGAAAGAVAVTAVAVPGMAAAVPADDSPDDAHDDVALDETVVARVRDLRVGNGQPLVLMHRDNHSRSVLVTEASRGIGQALVEEAFS